MSEFRQNKATKEWVIIAAGRGKRPSDFVKDQVKRPTPPPHRDDCPFCKGNEKMTPPSVYQVPNNDDWKIRVIPNKFAALQPDSGITRSHAGSFLSAKGYGVAEVIVETPEHDKTIATMPLSDVAGVVRAYRQREIEISKDHNINLVTIFRNHGPKAGTSLEHPHSQIIATPIVPPHVRNPIEQSVLHYDKYGSCVYCDILDEERRQKERVVVSTDNFTVICPWAARTPFETRIYPKRHMASFMLIDDDEIEELAWVLKTVLAKMYISLDNPDYNYVVRSAPIGDENVRYFHWYIVIIPKITTPAGFEIGSGIYINSVAPEDSAKFLRETKADI
jgi:UDPglucose--hexose-1-phosphate uridylyltransferase